MAGGHRESHRRVRMCYRDVVGQVSRLRRPTGRTWDVCTQRAGACSWSGRAPWAKRTVRRDGMARWRSSVSRSLAGCRMTETGASVDVARDTGVNRQRWCQLDSP